MGNSVKRHGMTIRKRRNKMGYYECDNFEKELCLCHKEGKCVNLKLAKKKKDETKSNVP